MTERAELDRQLVEAADAYQDVPEWDYLKRSVRRDKLAAVALALADAIRKEQEDD